MWTLESSLTIRKQELRQRTCVWFAIISVSLLTGITDDDYDRTRDAWTAFDCKTMRDYHDAYLKTDVLLLADTFEHFRSVCMQNYGLDPTHFYTTPGLSFQACLKMTGAKLDLFTNPKQ